MSKLKTNTIRHVDGGNDNITLDSSQNVTVEGNLNLSDDKKIILGNNDDFSIYHSPNNNYIDADTGTLHIRHSTETGAKFIKNGSCEFYHDNSKKFETTSAGVTVMNGGLVSTNGSEGYVEVRDERGADYKAKFLMAGSSPVIRNENTVTSDSTLTVQKGSNSFLLIDGNGNVTTPNQPCSFYVGLSNTATSNKLDSTETLVFATSKRNEGSHYNGTNGRFTAPVAGTYFVGVNILIDNAATLASRSCDLQKNGSGYATLCYHRSGGETRYEGMAGTGIIELAANDYISIRGTSGIHTGVETSFIVYLLG